MADLTFEQVDQLLAYDPTTGVLTWKVDRSNVKAGSVAGCMSNGYSHVRLHGRLYKAHRLAWILHTGRWPRKHLDHIDGCRSNNRIDNLRECNYAENQQNLGKRSNNTSGVTGVYWNKQKNKWMARIKLGGSYIYLGLFTTIEEAAQARAAAKAQYHTFNPVDRDNNK